MAEFSENRKQQNTSNTTENSKYVLHSVLIRIKFMAPG